MYTTKIYLKSDAPELTATQINELLRTGIDRVETSTIDKDNIIGDVRDGIQGGCYGARDGKTYEGVTVYLDCREVESEGNVAQRLLEYPHSIVDDSLVEAIDAERGNTYNYEYMVVDNHVEFTITEKLTFVRFHLGGDIRGNYSSWYAISIDPDEFASILFSFDKENQE